MTYTFKQWRTHAQPLANSSQHRDTALSESLVPRKRSGVQGRGHPAWTFRGPQVSSTQRTAGCPGSARFQREAQAASALNRPQHLHCHDIGEQDRQTFIAMELLEKAETLKQKIGSRPMSLETLLDYAMQIAAPFPFEW